MTPLYPLFTYSSNIVQTLSWLRRVLSFHFRLDEAVIEVKNTTMCTKLLGEPLNVFELHALLRSFFRPFTLLLFFQLCSVVVGPDIGTDSGPKTFHSLDRQLLAGDRFVHQSDEALSLFLALSGLRR